MKKIKLTQYSITESESYLGEGELTLDKLEYLSHNFYQLINGYSAKLSTYTQHNNIMLF